MRRGLVLVAWVQVFTHKTLYYLEPKVKHVECLIQDKATIDESTIRWTEVPMGGY